MCKLCQFTAHATRVCPCAPCVCARAPTVSKSANADMYIAARAPRDQLIGAARGLGAAAGGRRQGGGAAGVAGAAGAAQLDRDRRAGARAPGGGGRGGGSRDSAGRAVLLPPPPFPSSQLSRYFSPLSHLLPSVRPLHPYLCSLLPSLLPRPNSSSLSVPLCHWCLVATSFFCRAPARRPKQLRGAEPVRSVTP